MKAKSREFRKTPTDDAKTEKQGSPRRSPSKIQENPSKPPSRRESPGKASPEKPSPERQSVEKKIFGPDSIKTPPAGSPARKTTAGGTESPGKKSPTGGAESPPRKSPTKETDDLSKKPSSKNESRDTSPHKKDSNKKPSGGQSPDKQSKASITGGVDALNTEFIYYSAVLRTYTPTLSREFDKMTAHLWMKKLFGPEYHSTILKPKRNKYLLYLTITIYNDETFGIFRQEPPCGVLPELKDISLDKEFPPAAWECEKQWEETIDDLPEEMKFVDCYLHDGDCPPVDNNLNLILDAQFQFYLWLTRPYVALLTDPDNKTTVACWIQQLCGIAPEDSNCADMKNLRNEYMQVLLGYVHDLRVEGPFRRMPAAGAIPPLSMWYEHCEGDSRYNDPVEKEKEEFMASQPLPETGAFAYINVTGDMFGSQI